MKPKKILIISNLNYDNKNQIKNFLFQLKKRYGEKKFQVATLAKGYGVDPLVKKYAIEFGIKYGEFNPYHTHHRLYDIMPQKMFNKKYHNINFIHRDLHAVNWADIVVLFVDESYNTKSYPGLKNIVKLILKKKNEEDFMVVVGG